MSKFVDIVLPSFDDVRIATEDSRPDSTDCFDVADAQFRMLQAHFGAFREGRLKIHDPRAVAGPNYTQFNPRGSSGAMAGTRGSSVGTQGFVQAPISPACPPGSTPNGGTPQGACPPILNCGATPLGFNTFESSDYPLAGVTVGVIEEGEPIDVTSGRAENYQPLWMFFSARDTAAAFARIQGFITEATVNRDSQLAGDSLTNRPICSDIYDNVGPVMLDNWLPFTNLQPKVLRLSFGHALGVAVEAAFVGSFWGSAFAAPAK